MIMSERVIRKKGPPNQPRRVKRRLKSYRKIKERMFLRAGMPKKRKMPCRWCREWLALEEATVDHIVPLSDGGTNDRGNLVIACAPCNGRRNTENQLPKRRSGNLRSEAI